MLSVVFRFFKERGEQLVHGFAVEVMAIQDAIRTEKAGIKLCKVLLGTLYHLAQLRRRPVLATPRTKRRTRQEEKKKHRHARSRALMDSHGRRVSL